MRRSAFNACLSVFIALSACVCSAPASAQTYPSKSIRLVLGYAPGGGADALARLVAQKLTELAGQQAIVENKPGASGLLAVQQVATAPADGYTLLVMASSGVLAGALRPDNSHQIERDLSPVSLLAIQPLVLVVHPSIPVQNVKDFIAFAKSQPGKINFGSSGVGGASHLAGELFNLMADVKLFHVPYKGGSESVVAVASGSIQSTFASTTSIKSLVDAGKLKIIAVTSLNRTQLSPSTPTIAESGVPGYDAIVWYSMMGPAGMSGDTVNLLNVMLGKMLTAPEMKEHFMRQGLEPKASPVAQLRTMIGKEFEQSVKLIKAANLKAE